MPLDMEPGFAPDLPGNSGKFSHQYHMVEQFFSFGNAGETRSTAVTGKSEFSALSRYDDRLRQCHELNGNAGGLSPAPG